VLSTPFELLSLVECVHAGLIDPDGLRIILGGAADDHQPLLEGAASVLVDARIEAGDIRQSIAVRGREFILGSVGQLRAERAVRSSPTTVSVIDPGPLFDVAGCRSAGDRLSGQLRRMRSSGRVRRLTGIPMVPRPDVRVAAHERDARHEFAWSRGTDLPLLDIEVDRVVLGSGLAARGMVSDQAYRSWLRRVVCHDVGFAPHRLERQRDLDLVAELGGRVIMTRLPRELALRDALPSTRFVALPSTIVVSLPSIRASTTFVDCVPVLAHEWTPAAPAWVRAAVNQLPPGTEALCSFPDPRDGDRDG
jgi:hypothetical protein